VGLYILLKQPRLLHCTPANRVIVNDEGYLVAHPSLLFVEMIIA
jgi:hypothetical protein